MESSKILSNIRSLMLSHSPPLDALLVPSEDYHQSEYVSSRDMRRAFISGFTGSAGLALITLDGARLWTDGRYFLQAEQELSSDWTLMRMGEDPTVEVWLADNMREEASIGVDPWCISVDTAHRWKHAFTKKRQSLVETPKNLVDEIWENRPLPESNPIIKHPLEFAGCPVTTKLANLRKNLNDNKTSSIIITTLDDVAWLYNIRGNDVAYNPVVHSFAIVTLDSAFLYVDNKKVSDEIKSHLLENEVTLKEYDDIRSDAALLASNRLGASSNEGKFDVWVDPSSCCFGLYTILNHDKAQLKPSPIPLAKAIKNPVELEGLKKAHVRDGAAVVQFLVWLDTQMQEVYGASGYFVDGKCSNHRPLNLSRDGPKLTEVTVSDKLEAFRATKEHFRGLSFPTISSVGANAAIIHYTPQADTCAELDPNKIYLVDSGAQYLDGTTDITRTVHFGDPSPHERACYTAVLKGHIALGNSVFPNGTNGHTLDVLARVPLWQNGLDYRHGTGHGVGSYLYVHEGPHLISFRPQPRPVPLQACMTVTDEPGYYEDGNFGIRLENVLVIKNAETNFNFGGKGYLCFEHITWVPYQRKMIDVGMLMPSDIEWINGYHGACREILSPYLDESERYWLIKATDPIV